LQGARNGYVWYSELVSRWWVCRREV
jgi:hypothetical protein